MPEAGVLWTLADFVAATGGRMLGVANGPVGGISIDSRTLQQGDAFFAIRGESQDGHAYAAGALEKGARIAIVARERADEIAARPLLVVADPLEALENLARAARVRIEQTGARVFAVTGSVGKTGTKEALRAALGACGKVHASAASYNNQWGVPLSLARMPGDGDFAIFEIGMNHPGEITPLSRMVRPHAAIVTTIAAAHLGFFTSVDEIAAAKAEIFLGLEPGGTAILNRDDVYFDSLAECARAAGAARIVGFGADARADVRLIDVVLRPDCSTVSAHILGQRTVYKIGAPGRHLVMNSLAVLAGVVIVGADLARATLALADWSAPKGRGERLIYETPRERVVIIDESYNANPVSVRAAIALLSQTPPQGNGRRIAVLGDMLELGLSGEKLHAALAEPLAEAGVDLVYTAGPLMAALAQALPSAMRGGHASTSADLEPVLLGDVRPGDVIMVKGSLGSRMGPLVAALERHLCAHFEAVRAGKPGE